MFWHNCHRSQMKHRLTDLFLCAPVMLGMHFQYIQHQWRRFSIWTNVNLRFCSWVTASVGKLLLKHKVLHVTSSLYFRAISSSTMLLSLQSGPNFTRDGAFQPITYCCREKKFLLDVLQRSMHVYVPVDGEKPIQHWTPQRENSSRMINNCIHSWMGFACLWVSCSIPRCYKPQL